MDAPTLAMIKGLVAGTANVTLVLLLVGHFPSLAFAGFAAVVGLLGYGVSLVLFVLALREIGAARAAYFSTAPFIGAGAAILLLHDPVPAALIVAGVLMAFGVWLHLTEPSA